MRQTLISEFCRTITMFLIVLALASCGTRKKNLHRVSSIRETATSIRNVEASEITGQLRKGSIIIKDSRGGAMGKIYPKGPVSYNPQTGFTGEADSILFYGNFSIREAAQDSTVQNYSESKTSDMAGSAEAREDVMEVTKEKQSDTTWAANIPWYAWAFGGIVLVALGFVGLRRMEII